MTLISRWFLFLATVFLLSQGGSALAERRGARTPQTRRPASEYQLGARARYHPDVRRVPRGEATMVIRNAVVFTGVRGQEHQQAVAVKGDRIMAVGTNEEVQRHVGPGTRVVDARGRTVMPGMIETHGHLPDIVERAVGADLQRGDASRALREAPVLEGWIRGVGRAPALAEFDRATMRDGRPVPAYVESWAGSESWVNTAAMERAREYWSKQPTFYRERNPSYGRLVLPSPPGGGVNERTGTLHYANNLIFDGRDASGTIPSYEELGGVMPQLPYRIMREPLQLTMRYFAANGVTGFHDMMGTPHHLMTLDQLDREGLLTTRVYQVQGMSQAKLHTQVTPQFIEMMRVARERVNGERLYTGMVKFNDSETSIEELAGEVRELNQHGLQAAVHTHGDMIDGLALADRGAQRGSTARLRHRLEHTVGNLETAHRIGSGGTLQFGPPPRSLLRYRDTVLQRWGGGTDWDVIPEINPMNYVREAAQALGSVEEALHGYTSNAAWLGHGEHMVGSLRPGMKADIVMLNRDILRTQRVPRDTRPVLTMMDGQVTFEAEPNGDESTASHDDWANRVRRAGQDAARRGR